MAKLWSEVIKDPEFQQLPSEEKEAARQQYFAKVVSPQLPPEELGAAKAQFDQMYGPKPSEAAKEPGFFDPKATGERAVEGTVGMLPYVEAGKKIYHGEAPYENTPEGWGKAAGDVGMTAALGAGGLAKGALTLGKFAGLGGLFNALGVNKGAAMVGEGLEAPGNKVNLPSKMGGVEGLGTAMNFLARTPGGAAATAAQIGPYLLAGKAMSPAEVKAPAAAPKPVPVPLETPESLLVKYGGETTPAIRATSGMGRAVTKGVERLSATNPLTAFLPEGIQIKNAKAVNALLEDKLGPDVTNLSVPEYAGRLEDAVTGFKESRSARYGAAEEGLAGLDSKLPKPTGMMASEQIRAMLQEKGVPFDRKGFHPELLNGSQPIDMVTAKALVALDKQLRSAKTVTELLNQRRNIDRSGIVNFEAPPDAMGRLTSMARGIVNDTLNQAVESSGDAKAINAWKKANAEYSETQPVMKAVGKAQANQLLGPEALTKILTDKLRGADALDRLKANMSPNQWAETQKAMANAILDRSKMTVMPGEPPVISAAALKTNLGKNLTHVFQRLAPDQQAALMNAQKMMEKANLADLRLANPSGSGVHIGQGMHIGALLASPFAPHVLGPLAGETAGIGAYYGANKALPALRSGMQTAKAAMNVPIPGTRAFPQGLYPLLRAAMGARASASNGQ